MKLTLQLLRQHARSLLWKGWQAPGTKACAVCRKATTGRVRNIQDEPLPTMRSAQAPLCIGCARNAGLV